MSIDCVHELVPQRIKMRMFHAPVILTAELMLPASSAAATQQQQQQQLQQLRASDGRPHINVSTASAAAVTHRLVSHKMSPHEKSAR